MQLSSACKSITFEVDELPLSKTDSFYISSPGFNLLLQASGIFGSSKPVYIL